MHDIVVNYAKALGKKVLVGDRELILEKISLNHMECLNGGPGLIPVTFDECKMIVGSRNEIIARGLIPELCVIKRDNNYLPGEECLYEDDEKIMRDIIKAACADSHITEEQLMNNTKNRHQEYKWARYIILVVRHKLLHMSLAESGIIFNKDHATVLHDLRTVHILLGYREWREKYRRTWIEVNKYFPEAKNKFNLNWLYL